MASFMRGHDCLADLEEFRKDPLLNEVMKGETVAPRTMGDFLRDFEDTNLKDFNSFLSLQAKAYRLQLEKMLKKDFKLNLSPHLRIDSTSHIQHGRKMEGLAYNYKDEWCLDSQVIFDELGFCWDLELRPGNTKSGVGASDQIRRSFSSYKFKDEKYLSADSAYCNQEVIKTCLSLGVLFTITANQGTTGWENHIAEITNWELYKYSKEEQEIADFHRRKLLEVEIGRFYWQPSWSKSLRLPVIVKRQKYDEQEQMELGRGEYKYYGIVTNHSLLEWSIQEILEHHNKSGMPRILLEKKSMVMI